MNNSLKKKDTLSLYSPSQKQCLVTLEKGIISVNVFSSYKTNCIAVAESSLPMSQKCSKAQL